MARSKHGKAKILVANGITLSQSGESTDTMQVSRSVTMNVVNPDIKVSTGWEVIKRDISKTVEKGKDPATGKAINERVKIGEMNLGIPMLASFGIFLASEEKQADGTVKMLYAPPVLAIETEGENKGGILRDEDGTVCYADDRMNWLYSAVVAAIKAKASNAFVPGTAELKLGSKISENFEDLLAESKGRGEYFKLVRELFTAFQAWVQSLGKSMEAVKIICSLFGNIEGLQVQPSSTKTKMLAYVNDFAESLAAENLTRYSKYLNKVLEACAVTGDVADF